MHIADSSQRPTTSPPQEVLPEHSAPLTAVPPVVEAPPPVELDVVSALLVFDELPPEGIPPELLDVSPELPLLPPLPPRPPLPPLPPLPAEEVALESLFSPLVEALSEEALHATIPSTHPITHRRSMARV
jgi:hypothetical protein